MPRSVSSDRNTCPPRDYDRELLNALEAERARIARDLHDELSQTLLSAQLDVLWLQKRLAGNDPKVDACLAQLLDEIREGAGRMRKVAARLRPAIMDHRGLYAAIYRLVQQLEPRVEFAIGVEATDALDQLDEDVASTVFRVVQEGLTNAAKHAGCSTVTVRLRRNGEELELEVADDGVGVGWAMEPGDRPHLGIQGMHERARAVGGRLVVARAAGGGTRLRLYVPLRVDA